jgi:hypothetical protein
MAITVDQLRILLQDTGVPPILSDADYNEIIAIEPNNIYDAAAIAAHSISASFAEKVKFTAGPVSLENEQKFEHYQSLADSYRQLAREGKGGVNGGGGGISLAGTPVVTGISLDEMEAVEEDTDRFPGKFTVGMDDNKDTSQDYGRGVNG